MNAEIKELELVISHLDTCYELGEDCLHPITGNKVSDKEYDYLRSELQKVCPNSYVFDSVTASKVANTDKKVIHNPPMTSISKAIGTIEKRNETLKSFLKDAIENLQYSPNEIESKFVQSFKRDGVAIALYYENGKLVRAGLRPRDGINGEDVTENVQYVEGVASQLWEYNKEGDRVKFLPINCCIRGEIQCEKSVFKEVCENWQNPNYGLDSKPKNARNYAAGSIRQFKNPKVTFSRNLSFVAYSILSWSSKDKDFNVAPFKTEIERSQYSNSILKIPFVQARPFRYKDLETLEKISSTLNYEVDGVVISVNNLEDAEQLGVHGDSSTGNPKAKIAWKFQEEKFEVTVKEIVWSPGRTKITPVLQFDGVLIDGTTVSQCTAHSLGFIDGTSEASFGVPITRGTVIEIIKSGEIIPKVVSVVQTSRNKLVIPHSCPCCKQRLEIKIGETGKDLVCSNQKCGERSTAGIVHYLSTIGVKGIGESSIKDLIDLDLIQDQSDLYELNLQDLISAGFSPRESRLFLARLFFCENPTDKTDEQLEEFIEKAESKLIDVPAAHFFASLGITGCGKTAGQILINEFKSFRAVFAATEDDLKEIKGIGEASAESIVSFFCENNEMVDRLLEFINPVSRKIGKLTGKTFVFTGSFQEGKQYWENKISEIGGNISGSISSKTDYLVVGDAPGSKLEKAQKMKISSISVQDLQNML
ncbi:MAG: helix-hairpin-helix domain-containing protein [bacterium]